MVAEPALRWAALRALHEGAAASLDLLAQAAGRSPVLMRRRANKEGWRDAGEAAGLSGQERRLRALLDRQIAKAEAAAQEEGAGGASADKARMEAIAAVMRTLEKIGEITRGDGGAKENQTRRDEDMADILRRIDERIVELAVGYARELGGGPPDPDGR